MDDCRFDNWTRMLGAMTDRRTAVKDAAAAGAALVALAQAELGFAQESDILAESCRLSGEKCKRNKQCCSNKCVGRRKRRRKNDDRRRRRRRRFGNCRCLGNGANCRKDAACCRGFCDPNDRRCRCVPAGDRCERDFDCCRGSCRTDDQNNKFCTTR